MSKTWGFFLVAQDMVLSHRAKFQLIINFFRVKAISTGLLGHINRSNFREDLFLALHPRTAPPLQILATRLFYRSKNDTFTLLAMQPTKNYLAFE